MKHRRERGQSLAEFAIVFPVFMLILAGMIQLGVILWASNTLNQVVRDTGRYAATVCPVASLPGSTAVSDRFMQLYGESGGPWGNPVLSPVTYVNEDTSLPPCPDDNTGTSWVTIGASMDTAVFFLWVPGNGHVSSSTTFRVEPNP